MPSLYMVRPGARLELESGQLLVSQGDELLLAVPAVRVDQVIVVGGCHVTTPALAFLLDRGIGALFLTAGGQFRGRLVSGQGIPIATRRAQFRRADDQAFCLALAKAFIRGKIHNSRIRCLEMDEARRHPTAVTATACLADALAEVNDAPSLPALMGIEGRAATHYFDVMRLYVRAPWELPARARRPPPDPVNALLSILYTLLHESCHVALEAAGLDPACGFLHAERSGRLSLSLDLMEEFRPVIADSVALTLLNKRILTDGDFGHWDDRPGVRLNPEGWHAVAAQYARRLNTGILVPGRKTRTTYQKLLEVQARQLRNVILGKQAEYEPFLAR